MSVATDAIAHSRLETELESIFEAAKGVAIRVGERRVRSFAACRCDEGLACEHRRAFDLGDGRVVRVCATHPDLLGLAGALVATADRFVELQEEHEALFEELGTSYDSLSSIYEIGSDPSLLLSPERALAKILERALAFEVDLHAVAWLVHDGRLVPAQWRNTDAPEPRPADVGLVGRALSERRGIIVNRSPGAGDEPELVQAQRIAVAPMICRDDAIGALVVWHAAPGAFDSRLMGLLGSLASQAAMILEQNRLRQEAVEGERLRQEMDIGGRIQKTLLLGSPPSEVAAVDIGAVAEASRKVDGDFFGFFPHSDEVLDVLVGDVMGKGIPAALVGAAVKSQFLRFAATLAPSGERREPAEPAAVVAAVHEALHAKLVELGRFVTAVYARLDLGAGTVTYVDCGHTNTLHLQRASNTVGILQHDPEGPVNLPLGILPDTRFEQVVVPFRAGDAFVFYSDGLTEAEGESGRLFGIDALAAQVAAHAAAPAQTLANRLCEAVKDFAAEGGPNDDLTCIVVKTGCRKGAVLEIPARSGQLERVRDFVSACCRRAPGPEIDSLVVGELHLALTEAVSNVIRHGQLGKEETLRIEAEIDVRSFRFVLLDRGRPFDPERVEEPCFDGTQDGGFGVYMIRNLMDETEYTRDERGRNRLVLVKRRKAEGE